ncbi:hypothetical protein D3C75_536880 [compost metagenome]
MYFRWHLERHALTEIVDILDKLFPALSGYLERLTQAGTSGLEFGVYPGGIRKLSDEQEERLKETIAKQRTVDARFEAKCTWTFVHGSFASSARNIP